MNTNRGGKRLKVKSLTKRIYDAGSTLTRYFDGSFTARLTHILREKFLCLQIRVAGVFFLTFGIYSFLIATLLSLFTEIRVDLSSFYGGALTALASLPLIFSKGNIASALSNSKVGSVICDHLNIRPESLSKKDLTGHPSIAFVSGVIAGALTFIFPFSSIISAIALAIIFGVILSSPETGLVFSFIFLLIANRKLQYVIIGITVVSYIFKLIRSKRKICIKRHDILILVFAVCTLGGCVFVAAENSELSAIKFAVLLIPYFLAVFLLRDLRKIKKLLSAAVITAGTLAAVYILGFAVSSMVPSDIAVDPDFLLRAVSSMPAYESGFAPLAFAALIPVCVAFIMKPRSEAHRFTLWLCLGAMSVCLLITEELAFAASAIIATVLLLLITGSRKIYFFMAAVISTSVVLSFAGSFGNRIYSYIYEHIHEAFAQVEAIFTLAEDPISKEFIFCGYGFVKSTEEVNFFYSLVYRLGIAGTLVLALFLLFVITEAVILIYKTYRSGSYAAALSRFSSTGSSAEIRLSMLAVLCALAVVLLSATFSDYYKNELSYMFLFLICGICSAYARSAIGEIEKAEGSLLDENTKERASTILTGD